jgi:hypothetical protein
MQWLQPCISSSSTYLVDHFHYLLPSHRSGHLTMPQLPHLGSRPTTVVWAQQNMQPGPSPAEQKSRSRKGEQAKQLCRRTSSLLVWRSFSSSTSRPSIRVQRSRRRTLCEPGLATIFLLSLTVQSNLGRPTANKQRYPRNKGLIVRALVTQHDKSRRRCAPNHHHCGGRHSWASAHPFNCSSYLSVTAKRGSVAVKLK